MVALLAALLVQAAPVKVAVPGFTLSGVDATVGDAWVDRFITLLSADGSFKLTTSRDIAQVLGIERQRELLGCSDAKTSCLAELAGALGVDAILTGTVVHSGAGYSATLRVLKANNGSQIAAVTGRLKDVDALEDWLDAQVPEVARQLRAVFGLEAAAAAPPGAVEVTGSPAVSAKVRLLPVVAGGVLAVAGTVLFGLSKGEASALRSMSLTMAEIDAHASTGRTFEGAGLGLIIAGGVAVAAGLVWLLLGGS